MLNVGIIKIGHVKRGVMVDPGGNVHLVPVSKEHPIVVLQDSVPWSYRTQIEVMKKALKSRELHRSIEGVLKTHLQALLHAFANGQFLEHSIKRLQERWRDVVTNPQHPVCISRLRWEYEMLTQQ